jgi:hypothetical protein
MRNMKTFYTIIFLLFASLANGQKLFTKAEFQAGKLYKGKDISTGIGGSILSGFNFNGVTAAGGFSVLFFDTDTKSGTSTGPYMPLFAEVGYSKPERKFALYVAARAGYGVYNGDGRMIGNSELTDVNGGLYLDSKLGLSVKHERLRVIPYIGASNLSFRAKQLDKNFSSQFYNAGLQIEWQNKR